VTCQQSHVSETGRTGEDGLEEQPTVGLGPRKIDRQLSQNGSLTHIAGIGHECSPKLTPPCRMSNIDEPFDATPPEGQDSLGGSRFEFTKQCDRWNPREFPHEGCNSRREPAGTSDGNQYCVHLSSFEIPDHIIDGFSMQRPVASFTRCVDP